MEWLAKLVAKLPSWRGITEIFYVIAHWSEISREREEFRKQIRDRSEWLEQQAEYHNVEKGRLQQEASEWAEQAKAGLDLARQSTAQLEATKRLLDGIARDLVDSTWLLAVMLSTEAPPIQASLLAALSPAARALVRARMEKLPPPPPQRLNLATLARVAAAVAPRQVPPLPPQQNFQSEREDRQ